MANHEQGRKEKPLAGVVGFFDDPESLVEGTREVKRANFPEFDAFTPFPVHGLEEAQGLQRSWLPWVTLGAGLTGFSLAFLLQYWTSAVSWPLIVGGKPFNSWPAFVPIMFELTVLFAGIATFVAMLVANGLPNRSKKSFDPSITRDRFALFIGVPENEAGEEEEESGQESDEKASGFNEDDAMTFLKQIGAKDVRKVYQEGWF